LIVVETEREMGDRAKSPFKILTTDLQYLYLSSNGIEYPNLHFKPEANNYLQCVTYYIIFIFIY